MAEPGTVVILGCAFENVQADGVCSVPVWVEKPVQVLPPLTLEQGTAIGFAIVSCWAVGLGARLIFRAVERNRY